MGCGCGKNRNNKIARSQALLKKTLTSRLLATEKYRNDKKDRRKIIEKKLKACKNCPYSAPTRDELRKKTRICHKTNTSIQIILNKDSYKCPLGHF